MKNRCMSVKTLEERFSIEKAHRAQIELSKHITFEDRLPSTIRNIVGVDVAYTLDLAVAAAVSLDFNTLKRRESRVAIRKDVLPYFPTLLSFREIPATMTAIRKLRTKPDLILANGHGYAHPYRCGLASHLGLALKKPTIGVAKTLLVGALSEHDKSDDTVFILDQGQVIGAQVKTKSGTKPIYISVGHMISLDTAIRIVKHCAINTRIPEPIALAHHVASAEKRKINIVA